VPVSEGIRGRNTQEVVETGVLKVPSRIWSVLKSVLVGQTRRGGTREDLLVGKTRRGGTWEDICWFLKVFARERGDDGRFLTKTHEKSVGGLQMMWLSVFEKEDSTKEPWSRW